MVEIKNGAFYQGGVFSDTSPLSIDRGRENTLTYQVISKHNNSTDPNIFKLKFDALASHDITYVSVIQTARASGLEKFPVPYVLTNCHNSLCAVGGTINADDHAFGLSAAKRYGGEYVPAHLAVIHQYMRERYAAANRMILATDSHTRYGAFGCLAIGEGGPEIVKQLLGRPYELAPPKVWAVYIKNSLRKGVGAQDVALALIGKVFPQGLVKNCVLEFVGPGIKNLDMDTRLGIDVMTTETTCLSSIWETDETVREWLKIHGREDAYAPLSVDRAYYDGVIEIDLAKIEPMIALPFHPSNVHTIREFLQNAPDLLREIDPVLLKNVHKNGVLVEQGIIAGCAGGLYTNVREAAAILKTGRVGNELFELVVYPSSQPMTLALTRDGSIDQLIGCGATVKTAFCGPCFGAGDVPVNNGLSIRHTTRNFPNREGSKPANGQSAFVALMDARSITATAANGGYITPADEVDYNFDKKTYIFDDSPYKSRVFSTKPDPTAELKFGPGISDWPPQVPLSSDIELKITSVLLDDVTTTDELIPSGETSSYRSNPEYLAEFTLSRRDPQYVARAKAIRELEVLRRESLAPVEIGSAVVAKKPGDGSAREQAASCQRVLGGLANIAKEYATKRYRSNLINWGIIPFICDKFDEFDWKIGDSITIRGVREAILSLDRVLSAEYHGTNGVIPLTLSLPELTRDEADVLLSGCLINYYKNTQ